MITTFLFPGAIAKNEQILINKALNLFNDHIDKTFSLKVFQKKNYEEPPCNFIKSFFNKIKPFEYITAASCDSSSKEIVLYNPHFKMEPKRECSR